MATKFSFNEPPFNNGDELLTARRADDSMLATMGIVDGEAAAKFFRPDGSWSAVLGVGTEGLPQLLAYSPAGAESARVMVHDDGGLAVDAIKADGTKLATIGIYEGSPILKTFHPDGQQAALIGIDETGDVLVMVYAPDGHQVYSVALKPNGGMSVTGYRPDGKASENFRTVPEGLDLDET